MVVKEGGWSDEGGEHWQEVGVNNRREIVFRSWLSTVVKTQSSETMAEVVMIVVKKNDCQIRWLKVGHRQTLKMVLEVAKKQWSEVGQWWSLEKDERVG